MVRHGLLDSFIKRAFVRMPFLWLVTSCIKFSGKDLVIDFLKFRVTS